MAPLLIPGDGRLLKHRSFVAFWLARTSSGFGYQMLSIIVGWQIYSQTQSAFWLGMIGLVQFVPSVSLALFAGHIADRFDRRRVVMLGQVCEWAAIVALAWLTWHGDASVDVMLALIFIISCAKTMESPSMISMLPAPPPPTRCLARRRRLSARRWVVFCMRQARTWFIGSLRRSISFPCYW